MRRPEAHPTRALLILALSAIACGACGGGRPEPTADAPASPAGAGAEPPFVDLAAASGLDFEHFNGMSGELYLSEMMGAGAGLLDYDNDGDLDVYLVQGRMLNPRKEVSEATFPPPPGTQLRDRLYRNDLDPDAPGGPRLGFTDVTEKSGIRATGYGMGVAAGDIDNDGWVDLYLSNAGPNQMLRNRGDGSFEDVTAATSTDVRTWSASATFLDFDLDGWLDLYVVNYVDFTVANHKPCRWLTGAPDYCGPQSYRPQTDRLFRNRGDGTFEDVSGRAGILGELASGLGVIDGDWNGDGWPDLYVANDGMRNFLWFNQGDGTFREEALAAGCALNAEGRAEAGMGVVSGDFDADGDEDLLVTHLALETNTLYRNDGRGSFDDRSSAAGVGMASWAYTSFGNAWLDFDGDGWLDLLAVNGAVKIIPDLATQGDPNPIHMPNQLFRNDQGKRLEEISETAGELFELSEVSRGVATGDLDNDGDVDAVMTNNSGPARLLINQAGNRRPWLGLELVTGDRHRDALGAWVHVLREEEPQLWRRVRAGGSYLSARDPRLTIGLGDSPRVTGVEVRWPGGGWEAFEVEPGRYQTLRQGGGRPVAGGEGR